MANWVVFGITTAISAISLIIAIIALRGQL